MGRQRTPKELRLKLQQLVRSNIDSQESARKLIEDVLAKIRNGLESTMAGTEMQLVMLEKLSECAQSIGKSNETNLKCIALLDNTEHSDDEDDGDDSELSKKSTAEVLAEISASAAKRRF